MNIIRSPNTIESLELENFFPKIIYMGSTSLISLINKSEASYEVLPSIHLFFKSHKTLYWEMKGDELEKVSFYVHSDYIMGNVLGDTLRNMSVIGFYVTIVLAIG